MRRDYRFTGNLHAIADAQEAGLRLREHLHHGKTGD
jgi:hypothetical protein